MRRSSPGPGLSTCPSRRRGKPIWPVFVPAIGKDGNDLPGVRLPEIAAPTGTYLSWNLRKEGFAAGDLCMIFGSYVPFARDAGSRGQGDHRPALDELYPTAGDRVKAYSAAAEQLARDRFLLLVDAKAMVESAAQTSERRPKLNTALDKWTRYERDRRTPAGVTTTFLGVGSAARGRGFSLRGVR